MWNWHKFTKPKDICLRRLRIGRKRRRLNRDRKYLLALGNAYLAGEQYGAAVREYQELLQAAPEMEIVREQLAKAFRAEGREAEAEVLLAEPSVEARGSKQH